jgi:hypothetical protein
MNTYNNIQWRETDFHKQSFQDATEFFDMLHIKSAIIPVVPLKHADLIPDAISPSTHIIGAYEFDRRTNQNAYIILRVQSSKATHYRLIQAERTYDHWNIGGVLTSFHLTTFEAKTLNDLVVQALPGEILEIIYLGKSFVRTIVVRPPKVETLAEYGRRMLREVFWEAYI